MHLVLHTTVAQAPAKVFVAFDAQLFGQLAPPFPKLRVLRFDGSLPGHLVELELDFLLYRQRWTSIITESGTDFFVDEGQLLPAPLRQWRHAHRVLPTGTGSTIVDDVTYSSGYLLLDTLLYPALWLLFAYRRPIYRRIFA